MVDTDLLKNVAGIDPVQALQRWDRLTPKELEVAEKLAHGLSNGETAARMGISPKTLGIHRTNLNRKLAVKTLAGIAMYYFVIHMLAGE